MGRPAGLLRRLVYAVCRIDRPSAALPRPAAGSGFWSLAWPGRGAFGHLVKRRKSVILSNEVNHLDMYCICHTFSLLPPDSRVKVVSLTKSSLAQMDPIMLRGAALKAIASTARVFFPSKVNGPF